jgi:cytochrome c biogenesis protein CcdA
MDGGKMRPLGVIFGLLTSFLIFSLFLGGAFKLLNLRPELIRLFASLMIVAFSMVMIFSNLSDRFSDLMNGVANKVNKLLMRQNESESRTNGFVSGIFIGGCLGLIWSPCIGPLLGIAVTQAAAKVSLVQNLILMGTFALGVALPMLAVTFLGRQLLDKIKFLRENNHILRRTFGTVMLTSVLLTSSSSILFAQTWFKANVLKDQTASSQLYSNTETFQVGCPLDI